MTDADSFCRVAAVVPEVVLASPLENARLQAMMAIEVAERGVGVVVFPELSLTGYSCGDLFLQQALLDKALDALVIFAESTRELPLIAVVGVPIQWNGRVFNCAAVCSGGKIWGLVPKTFLPSRGEFYEPRWFQSGGRVKNVEAKIRDQFIPFGTDLLFGVEGDGAEVIFGIEICEDLWAVEPPSSRMALAGAQVILNLSASPETLGKAEYRRKLVEGQSARAICGYIFASAGWGESSADLVFGGHALIAENGVLLVESERFRLKEQIAIADLDIGFLEHERRVHPSFSQGGIGSGWRKVALPKREFGMRRAKLQRHFSREPFVPTSKEQLATHCREIFSIQSHGLARRLAHAGNARPVVGISGGLDSTLALLVSVQACELIGLLPRHVLAVTMPGPGTSELTRSNATRLAELLRVELREIPITSAVEQHLESIGHKSLKRDTTYENVQARERTQILMSLANQEGGIVVGTGDLSEMALGWCTYNGDQMSMYHVNAGVPKTLIRHLVEWSAREIFGGELGQVLIAVCQTPISPELLPPDKKGEIGQKTEELLGPYEVHDFLLYHSIRRGASPSKALRLAEIAFDGIYPPIQLRQWAETFYNRFRAAQFKRNAAPDGPKVGTVCLSQRGDWRMPSDLPPTAEPKL